MSRDTPSDGTLSDDVHGRKLLYTYSYVEEILGGTGLAMHGYCLHDMVQYAYGTWWSEKVESPRSHTIIYYSIFQEYTV